MPKLKYLQNPGFLEAAAVELCAEAERVQAAAQRLRAGQSLGEIGAPDADANSFNPFLEFCSNICGQYCFAPAM